jgi:NitT/TauT family transport system permease protein
MRYTHSFHVIRHKKHRLKISILITGVILLLIFVLGFTILNAEQFFVGFLESLTRVTISYFIALVIAIILALFTTLDKKIENFFLPILDVLQSFPSFALFPLFVIWFGRTSIVTIFILIITMIWPILFTILSGRKLIKDEQLEAAKIFGAKRIKYLRYVLLPLLFPSIITGSIVAWGEAWEAIIAAEIIVNIKGVGTYLAQNGQNFNSSVLVVGILLLLGLLFILNKYIWLPLLNVSTKYQE